MLAVLISYAAGVASALVALEVGHLTYRRGGVMTAATTADLARDARSWFERATRADGNEFWRTRDGRPDWLQELIRNAHGDLLPDDWRYRFIVDALDAIIETADADYPEEAATDIVRESADVYTGQLLEWCSSNLQRAGIVDETMEELGWGAVDSLAAQLALGQERERLEVLDSVRRQLEELAADLEDDESC